MIILIRWCIIVVNNENCIDKVDIEKIGPWKIIEGQTLYEQFRGILSKTHKYNIYIYIYIYIDR